MKLIVFVKQVIYLQQNRYVLFNATFVVRIERRSSMRDAIPRHFLTRLPVRSALKTPSEAALPTLDSF
jgi:hypothetical protein